MQQKQTNNIYITVLKKTGANILDIRSILNSQEKYLLGTTALMPVFFKFYWDLPPISLIMCGQYFIIRSIGQIIKEKLLNLKSMLFKKPDVQVIRPVVRFKDMYKTQDYIKTIKIPTGMKMPVMLGVDIYGDFIIKDLMKMYHTFISGESGGGKSTILNAIIQSSMYFCNNTFYIMLDFKKVGLGPYRDFENVLFLQDREAFKDILQFLYAEMDRRNEIFLQHEVLDIFEYQELGFEMPYIVLIIDEMSCISLNNKDKDLENLFTELINMCRSTGIVIIACTQNPAGVEINTQIRNKFITNLSARIERPEVQRMTCVTGTKGLKTGEFMDQNSKKFKAFFQNRLNNKVFQELKAIYKREKM